MQGRGQRKEERTSPYTNMLLSIYFLSEKKVVSTAQSNLRKRARDSFNHPISTISFSPGLIPHVLKTMGFPQLTFVGFGSDPLRK